MKRLNGLEAEGHVRFIGRERAIVLVGLRLTARSRTKEKIARFHSASRTVVTVSEGHCRFRPNAAVGLILLTAAIGKPLMPASARSEQRKLHHFQRPGGPRSDRDRDAGSGTRMLLVRKASLDDKLAKRTTKKSGTETARAIQSGQSQN